MSHIFFAKGTTRISYAKSRWATYSSRGRHVVLLLNFYSLPSAGSMAMCSFNIILPSMPRSKIRHFGGTNYRHLQGSNLCCVDAEVAGKRSVSGIWESWRKSGLFPTTSAFTLSRVRHPEDGGSTFLRNVGTHTYHKAYKPKRRPPTGKQPLTSPLWNFLYPPVTSCLLGLNTLLSTLFSKAPTYSYYCFMGFDVMFRSNMMPPSSMLKRSGQNRWRDYGEDVVLLDRWDRTQSRPI
jgi:hypothetical protein